MIAHGSTVRVGYFRQQVPIILMKKYSVYNRQSLKRIQDYPDILTVEETSELLGICTKTVYNMINEGNSKPKKLAG